jgi:hypothetical protein
VAEHDGKGTLGVLARQGVGIGMADTGMVDLDADLVGLGGSDFDILNGEGFASAPGDGRLALGVRMVKMRTMDLEVLPCR